MERRDRGHQLTCRGSVAVPEAEGRGCGGTGEFHRRLGTLLTPQTWQPWPEEKRTSGSGLSTGVFAQAGLLRTHGLESSQPLGLAPSCGTRT